MNEMDDHEMVQHGPCAAGGRIIGRMMSFTGIGGLTAIIALALLLLPVVPLIRERRERRRGRAPEPPPFDALDDDRDRR